jgi:hypothetical protein
MENKKDSLLKEKFKNKKIIIIAILFLLLIMLIPIGYSLFSDVKNNETGVKIGKINVVLKEDWPEIGDVDPENPTEEYDEFGIKRYTKVVKGVSTEEQDAYVRIRCIPVVEYYVQGENEGEGEWITAPVEQEDIIVTINSDDWVKQGDYWYYKKILKGKTETAPLNIDWQIVEIPSQIKSNKMRTDVRVMLEYAQVTNNMWKEIFQIDDLPTEVERVQE